MSTEPCVPKQYTAAGSLSTSPASIEIVVVLTAGSGADARATIKKESTNGTDGTVVFELAAVQGTTSNPFCLQLVRPYLSAITGAGASLTVMY